MVLEALPPNRASQREAKKHLDRSEPPELHCTSSASGPKTPTPFGAFAEDESPSKAPGWHTAVSSPERQHSAQQRSGAARAGRPIIGGMLRAPDWREADLARTQMAQRAGPSQQKVRSVSTQSRAHHPVFGELLHDFGYKMLYLSSARKLVASVPPWCRQRPVEMARVAEIIAVKAADGFRYPGVISIFVDQSAQCDGGQRRALTGMPQTMGVFDGQHRLRAIHVLLSSSEIEISDRRCSGPARGQELEDVQVLAEVYPVRSEEDVKRWYLELNKAEIVKEIDLPDAIAPGKKKTIDEAVDSLRAKFADMFKPSERCRAPHMHRDTLRNKLFNHDILGDALSCPKALLELLLRVNTALSQRPESSWPVSARKALPKARANNFFLGLNDYGWLEFL